MARLIDADKMAVDESEAYMSAQAQITDNMKWLINFTAHSIIQRLIADTPTVDAVPVVRCKDCRYWGDEAGVTVRPDGVMFARCKVHNLCVKGESIGWCPTEDAFCSLGESRGDNGSASMSDN